MSAAQATTLGPDSDLSRAFELAQQLSVDSVRASTSAGSGHPTSSLSVADLMAVLMTRHLRYATTFAAFLTRAHDFIRIAAVSDITMALCGTHSGVEIGADGPSQMGVEDLAIMRAVRGSTVLYPSDGAHRRPRPSRQEATPQVTEESATG